MSSALRLGVSSAAYARPLVRGLAEQSALFDLHHDIPAQLAYEMIEHTGKLQCAFLSPIDYARHAGTFRIVPDCCAASSQPTGTVRLFIKSDASNIGRVAVDVRVTSDIVLAKIILSERFPNLPSGSSNVRFIPMVPGLPTMLQKADAALIGEAGLPIPRVSSAFHIDLVQEWSDLTGLPYVHGMWVTEEGSLDHEHKKALLGAKRSGVEERQTLAAQLAQEGYGSIEACRSYLGAFSYDLGDPERQALEEFIQYAFFYGVIPDAPELSFLESPLRA